MQDLSFNRGVFFNNATQHSVHPTGGSLRVFRHFAWLEVGSVKAALSRPAHTRVTQAVGVLLIFLSFNGYRQFEYFGVFLFIVGIAPVIKVLKNQKQVSNSIRLLGYTEIVVALALIIVGIIGYGLSGWFSITYLVGSWAGIPIWTGLFRLSILFIACVIVSRYIK